MQLEGKTITIVPFLVLFIPCFPAVWADGNGLPASADSPKPMIRQSEFDDPALNYVLQPGDQLAMSRPTL